MTKQVTKTNAITTEDTEEHRGKPLLRTSSVGTQPSPPERIRFVMRSSVSSVVNAVRVFMIDDPRTLLRSMFDAAVARAMPEKCVPPFLPKPPKGRTLVVGAGKAAATMAKAVEDNWPGIVENQITRIFGKFLLTIYRQSAANAL